jgi:hypothetical protein
VGFPEVSPSECCDPVISVVTLLRRPPCASN